ncbi:MAG: hypothetical protein ACI4OM_02830 [Evtepia sp.]
MKKQMLGIGVFLAAMVLLAVGITQIPASLPPDLRTAQVTVTAETANEKFSVEQTAAMTVKEKGDGSFCVEKAQFGDPVVRKEARGYYLVPEGDLRVTQLEDGLTYEVAHDYRAVIENSGQLLHDTMTFSARFTFDPATGEITGEAL